MTALAALALACAPPPGPPPRARVVAASTVAGPASCDYTIRFDARLRRMNAEVCLPSRGITQLVPPTRTAREYLLAATLGDAALPLDDGVISLPAGKGRRCVRYAVDVAEALRTGSAHGGALEVGGAALLSPDLWLWVPEPLPDGVDVRTRFELPGSMQVVVPWQHVVPRSAFLWKMQGAVGRLDRHDLQMGGARFEVSVLGGGWGPRTHHVLSWVQRSAEAVAGLLGAAPSPRVPLLLLPVDVGGYGFGFATRGGGPMVSVMLAPDIGDTELACNWIAVHELVHLWLPVMRRQDAWLYEGLATYLAAVARARSGMVSEPFAWGELLDGFARGRATGTGRSLAEESAHMPESRAYWRVYWAGAAIALELDVALRDAGHGGLDTALRKLRGMTRPSDYTCHEVLAQLDKATGTSLATAIAGWHLNSSQFPEVDKLATRLGISLLPDKTAAIDPKAPATVIRRAIMSRR